MTDAIRDRIATLADNFTPRIAAERICDQFIIINREELPLMTAGAHGNYLVIGDQKFAVPDCDPKKLRQIAGGLFAYAEQIESERNATRRRRNELAKELTEEANGKGAAFPTYAVASWPLQRAIDRIIELEQAQP